MQLQLRHRAERLCWLRFVADSAQKSPIALLVVPFAAESRDLSKEEARNGGPRYRDRHWFVRYRRGKSTMPASPLELLTFIVSVVSMIVSGTYAARAVERARAANQIAEASLRFQVLLPALFEYRSVEMLVAIRSLWDFAREHPNDIAEAYRSRREQDLCDLAGLKGDEHVNYLRATVDFHRRQVSQFYGFLTSVFDEGGSQRKWIYTHWGKSDLEIIPRVIVPMERALGEAIGSASSSATLDRLLRLYRDSPG